ncbi:protein fuzzy homolog [Penaeus monodon]|uniref:protein fuzzy homolog n=1 Tax=Penaeus monodon TaxID=6687 RepID=UPI0018A75FF2|nr:protein fuzzy homolog [Penaeus monodon]
MVYTFLVNLMSSLCTTRTQNASLRGKHIMIALTGFWLEVVEKTGDSIDSSLLDLMFASLVLLLGLDTVTSSNNIERLKRDIKNLSNNVFHFSIALLPIADELLFRAVGGENHQGFSHLTGCAECVIPPEHHALQNEIEKFAESADSTYACVMMEGQVVSGTRNFWTLSHTELVLLPLLVTSNTFTVARDLPIYLPNRVLIGFSLI